MTGPWIDVQLGLKADTEGTPSTRLSYQPVLYTEQAATLMDRIIKADSEAPGLLSISKTSSITTEIRIGSNIYVSIEIKHAPE